MDDYLCPAQIPKVALEKRKSDCVCGISLSMIMLLIIRRIVTARKSAYNVTKHNYSPFIYRKLYHNISGSLFKIAFACL